MSAATHALDSCPRWLKCSVPICPLDPDWEKRSLANHEPTCFYLSESVKAGAEASFRERGREWLLAVMQTHAPAICARHPRIKKQLERAALSGSRMDRLPSFRSNIKEVAK